MTRKELREKELKFLAREYKKNPQDFQQETFIENAEFLEKFGIFIKNKNSFPLGYIKFWPQDFIVEEIPQLGRTQTVKIENLLDNEEKSLDSGPSIARERTLYATLVKCGLSTIEAVQDLASFLNQGSIQFAGIKDKDAITAQLISFRKIGVEKLQKITSPFFFLKKIYWGKGVIERGGLKGNEFTVMVRTDDSFQQEKFLENLRKIEREGFFNFFYLQRFGTPRLINFYWGLFILRGEYQKAILSFLCSPGQRELPYFQKLREKVKENFGNWPEIEKILKPFPLIFQNERKIASFLKNYPQDFIGALNQIPEQIQLWLFAYASWLFNAALATYLKQSVKLPETIPLILSKNEQDWLFYKEFLKEDKIFSIPLKNLRSFPYVQWRKREIKTGEKVKIHKTKTIPEGIILNFTLPKAAYATTFLAHLFNLVSGLPPKNISSLPIDTKATLEKGSLEEVLNKFKEVIYPKTENILEKLSKNE